jgi:hypothetical protein
MTAINKNLLRLKRESWALLDEYKTLFGRLRYVTLIGMKSRVPAELVAQGHPDNNELFHLLTAFIEEFYDKAPRMAAYRDITLIVIACAWAVFS